MVSQDPGRLIVRSAQSSAAGFAGRIGARLLFLFFAARTFGATACGAYLVAVAAVELAVTIGALGTKKTIFQLLEESRAEPGDALAHRLLDAALLVFGASAVVGGGIAAAAVALPPAILAPATATALLLLAPMVAGQALLDLFLAATRWRHTIRYEVIARSLIEPWALLAGLGAGWLLDGTVGALATGYWCGTLCSLAYAGWGARRQFGGLRLVGYRPRPARLACVVRGAGSNSGNDFLNSLYGRADLYLVSILLGEAGAGVYGVARQLAAPLRQVRQSFDGLLIPFIAHSLSTRGPAATAEALASATRLILVLQLSLLLLLLLLGDELLRYLGPGFAAGYGALLALAAAETIQASLSIGDLVFIYLRPRTGLWVTLSSTVLGLGAALLLIPPVGLLGAGLSVLCAYFARALLRRRLLRTRFALHPSRVDVAAPVAAAAVAALVGAATGALAPPFAGLVAAILVYCAIVAVWATASGHRLRLFGFTVPSAAPGSDPAE